MSTKSVKLEQRGESNIISPKYNRQFSEEFRRQKVKELTEKTIKIKDICDVYGVSRTTVYKWLYLYSPHHERGTKQVVEMESEAHKTKQLLHRVAELERIVGQKQMEIDFLSKLIDISSQELKVDLKKNFVPLVSNGIGDTKSNTII